MIKNLYKVSGNRYGVRVHIPAAMGFFPGDYVSIEKVRTGEVIIKKRREKDDAKK